MIFNKYNLLIILCFFIIRNAQAQITTDRPDQTESSSTVGIGNLQIEGGLLIGFTGSNGSSVRQILAPTNLFRYGITDGIEIRFLSQFETSKFRNAFEYESIQGISDLEIGTKIQVLQNENKNTEIAFLSHLIIPSGSNEFSSKKFGTINKISIAHELNENMGVGYNIGYNYFGEENGDLTYSLALGIAVNEKVGIYIEPYGEIVNLEKHEMNFDAGFTYLPNQNLQFDFSFGTGISKRMNYISIGGSWLLLKDKN